jgi:hypothetical protein
VTKTTAERLYHAIAEALRTDGDPALCEALRLLGEHTGQNKFRNMASIAGGNKLGRAAIDDSDALRRIEALRPDRGRDAVGIVAREMVLAGEGGSAKADAIERRLRRKLRKRA